MDLYPGDGSRARDLGWMYWLPNPFAYRTMAFRSPR